MAIKKKSSPRPSGGKKTATIPFDFVLEALMPADPLVRPMFGGYAIYINGKVMMMLRRRDTHTDDNGVWVATSHEHHESLRKDFASLRTIGVFGVKESGWQILPEDSDGFEEEVLKACRLILKGDVRIGKVPKPKKKKKKKEE
ncbi:hypothetical protein [Chryseolinea lacunae]|uniref:TfoX N-terminal domain-containing protein n=1 Tax=Chryseolinea lacunae TaxID=2801331 RepID=A0ABS1KQI4_9BACT|nr:hypothetical protein [Chryseolinea lacunae]MBL0741734.1 hypothetical protein [Chryseolinea lacunae]